MKIFIVTLLLFIGSTQPLFAKGAENIQKYFPMAKGMEWKYVSGSGKTYFNAKVISCDESVSSRNGCVFEEVIESGTFIPPKFINYSYKNSSSVMSVEIQMSPSDTFETINPQIILKLPLSIGTSWESQSGDEEKSKYRIVDKIGKINILAGQFNNVIKVEKKIYSKDTKTNKWIAFEEGKFDAYLYYAPNVGLIKEDIVKSNEVFRELKKFSQGLKK